MSAFQTNFQARRAFMQRMGHLGAAGIAAPWAMNLAAMGEAAAFSAPANDYKALVCVFLYGGNDYANTLIPYDLSTYNAYASIRTGIVTPRANLANTVLAPVPANVLPGGQQLAMASELAPLKTLFDAGKLAVQLNVGTLVQPTTLAQYNAKSVPLPAKLFSHNDQQSAWQSSKPEGSVSGWGGRIGDMALSNNSNAVFTNISVTGNAVFLAGSSAVQYQVTTAGAVKINGVQNAGIYGSSSCGAALKALITQSSSHLIESEYTTITARAIDAEGTVTQGLTSSPAVNTVFATPNTLADQLKMVARLIAARSVIGVKRQVFMVSIGGFDLHDFLIAQHGPLLAQVASAMRSFYDATVELGVENQVTAFTASDFGRTLASNGDGSDHGWGSHHWVMGGAVNGRRFYGTAPATAVNGPDDVGQGRLLPSTSVDQFAATLATWFGVTAAELPTVVPNIGNYSQQNLGFV